MVTFTRPSKDESFVSAEPPPPPVGFRLRSPQLKSPVPKDLRCIYLFIKIKRFNKSSKLY